MVIDDLIRVLHSGALQTGPNRLPELLDMLNDGTGGKCVMRSDGVVFTNVVHAADCMVGIGRSTAYDCAVKTITRAANKGSIAYGFGWAFADEGAHWDRVVA